jgi:hypothetical protein
MTTGRISNLYISSGTCAVTDRKSTHTHTHTLTHTLTKMTKAVATWKRPEQGTRHAIP